MYHIICVLCKLLTSSLQLCNKGGISSKFQVHVLCVCLRLHHNSPLPPILLPICWSCTVTGKVSEDSDCFLFVNLELYLIFNSRKPSKIVQIRTTCTHYPASKMLPHFQVFVTATVLFLCTNFSVCFLP